MNHSNGSHKAQGVTLLQLITVHLQERSLAVVPMSHHLVNCVDEAMSNVSHACWVRVTSQLGQKCNQKV